MSDSSEAVRLELCPWCGGGMLIVEDRGDNACEPLLYRPQCWECGGGLGGFDTKAEAIAAWNRRATPSPEDASPGVGGREAIARSIIDELVRSRRGHGYVITSVLSLDRQIEAFLQADAILALSTGEGKEGSACAVSAARKGAAPEAGSSLDAPCPQCGSTLHGVK